MKKLKRERSEILLERHSKQAVPVLRTMLRKIGVGSVLGLIREITSQDRARILRVQPDAILQLDFEYAAAMELVALLEEENVMRWPQRPKKKR